MSKTEQEKRELAEEMTQKQNKIDEIAKVEAMIKDNKIEFPYKDRTYRVKKPGQPESREFEYWRGVEKKKLFEDSNYLFSKQWEELYRKKGKDVNEINKQIDEITNKYNEALVDLDSLREQNVKNEELIKKAKEKIKQIEIELNFKLIEKMDIYEYSIETKLREFDNFFLVYQVLEKKMGDKWVRVFADYKDFLNTNEDDLILKAQEYLNLIIINYRKQNANL